MHHYGLTGAEPYICPVKSQAIQVSQVAVPDVHAGDIETATIYHFYPELVDVEKARSLPPTQLGDDKIIAWLLGGVAVDFLVGRWTRPHEDIDLNTFAEFRVDLTCELHQIDYHTSDSGWLTHWYQQGSNRFIELVFLEHDLRLFETLIAPAQLNQLRIMAKRKP